MQELSLYQSINLWTTVEGKRCIWMGLKKKVKALKSHEENLQEMWKGCKKSPVLWFRKKHLFDCWTFSAIFQSIFRFPTLFPSNLKLRENHKV